MRCRQCILKALEYALPLAMRILAAGLVLFRGFVAILAVSMTVLCVAGAILPDDEIIPPDARMILSCGKSIRDDAGIVLRCGEMIQARDGMVLPHAGMQQEDGRIIRDDGGIVWQDARIILDDGGMELPGRSMCRMSGTAASAGLAYLLPAKCPVVSMTLATRQTCRWIIPRVGSNRRPPASTAGRALLPPLPWRVSAARPWPVSRPGSSSPRSPADGTRPAAPRRNTRTSRAGGCRGLDHSGGNSW